MATNDDQLEELMNALIIVSYNVDKATTEFPAGTPVPAYPVGQSPNVPYGPVPAHPVSQSPNVPYGPVLAHPISQSPNGPNGHVLAYPVDQRLYDQNGPVPAHPVSQSQNGPNGSVLAYPVSQSQNGPNGSVLAYPIASQQGVSQAPQGATLAEIGVTNIPSTTPASTGVCGATAIRAFTILWENVLNNWKTKYSTEIASGSTSTRKASYIEFALAELNRDGIHGKKYVSDVYSKAEIYEQYGLFDNSSIVVDLAKIIPQWFSSQVASSIRAEERAKLLHEHILNIFRMTDTLTPGNISIISSIINLLISFRLFEDVAIRSYMNKSVPSVGTSGARSSGTLSERLVGLEKPI